MDFSTINPILVNLALAVGILALAGAGVIGWLYWLKYAPILEARIGTEQWATIQNIIARLVQAAEEQFGPGEGESKEEWVLQLLVEQLDEFGIVVNEEFLRVIIKGIVNDLLHWDDEPQSATEPV